jgi:hypothetical protein
VEKAVLYKGEVVATETVYSDQILLAMLAARKKEYRKATQASVDVNVDVNAKIGIAIIPMTAPDVGDWERQAAIVHEQQKKFPSFDVVDVEGTEAPEKKKPAEPVQRTIERS